MKTVLRTDFFLNYCRPKAVLLSPCSHFQLEAKLHKHIHTHCKLAPCMFCFKRITPAIRILAGVLARISKLGIYGGISNIDGVSINTERLRKCLPTTGMSTVAYPA